ncbi:MAG: hypothetical protein K0R54_235 [Clostridiaceae bacterium]|jgi:predicted nucleotidyltransferase|nr:hypothetical protein [Clostridiaceae bacterium]
MNANIEIQINGFLTAISFLGVKEAYVFGSALFKDNPKDIDLLLILNKSTCAECEGCSNELSIMKEKNDCNTIKIFDLVKKYSTEECFLDVKVTYYAECIPEWVDTITPFGFEECFCGNDFFSNLKQII